MKRKLELRVLLVLLILLIIPFCLPSVVDSDNINPPRNPSIAQDVIEASESDVDFTWTSRWQTAPLTVENYSTMTGDHVVIKSAWESPVNSSRISIRSGFSETRNGTVVGPIEDEWPIGDPQDYSWEIIDGINSGYEVWLELNLSQNGDSAFDVWAWTDLDSDNEVDSDELGSSTLLRVDDWGMGIAESGSYISNTSGSIVVRLYCWLYSYSENMTYELQIHAGYLVDIDNEPDNPSEVVFDTYNLLRNITVNITLTSWNASGVSVIEFRNIAINNFFAPLLSNVVTHEIQSNVWNISWSCIERNANDTNYFSFWISADSGITYQLLARNLLQHHYVWDSTGYSMLEYLVRIRAFSLDFTFGNHCSTASPPTSYWPGDFSDATIELDAGDVHTGIPGFYTVTFNEQPDISYARGESGNVIVWVPAFHNFQPYVVDYQVYRNNTLWVSGDFYPSSDQSIEVNVDGLEIGTYEFRIEMDWPVSHSVIVTVYPMNNSDLDSPLFQLIHYGAIGVSIGSSFVIIMVIVMTIRLRRDYYSKLHS